MSAREGKGLRPAMLAARRRWLQQAGALASSTVLPSWIPHASAQTASTLNALPRVALVIGNTKYPEAPLKNPGNDARGIAGELQKLGFQVNLKLDAGRSEMIEAIRAFGAELGKKKGIGMFYYAGHGAQLAWKNYLIPVDAVIERIEDMQTRTVELNSLLEGLVKAQNPMNVIILDACRDNPFGSKAQTQQKGLSQFDAPPGSLLAYATSPGNTAADGEGANGLYTENLLRELLVPEAKIEDVFKRVRLNVRRKSAGQQIPWESTSLEDDFYFLPPAQVKTLSEQELDKLFGEELAIWENVKDAKEPGPLEDFLRRYPSGPYSELAQLQLERLLAAQGEKRIRIAVQEGNPFTRGSAEADTRWRVGDSYTYRHIDLLGGAEPRNIVQTVREITASEVHYGNGIVTDLLGNLLRRPGGRIYSPNQLEPLEYVVGKQWTTQFRITTPKGTSGRNQMELRIVGRESITVPAGTFNAFRIEGHGVFEEENGQVETTTLTKWVAPDRLRREVAMEETRERGSRGGGRRAGGMRRGGRRSAPQQLTNSQRWELVSFRQA
ncbi:MAG: caspase family protein [Betaproteobacteria bacterium]|nr:caspase family protein [Betaproteobacteria bacterium]